MRFPGQWFQLETGLAYNWHRHYDATTGRYVQPDPLLDDEGQRAVRGIPPDASAVNGVAIDANFGADLMGWLNNALLPMIHMPRSLILNGPNIFNYAEQSPLVTMDPRGLLTSIPQLNTSPIIGDPCLFPAASADDPQGLKAARAAATEAKLDRQQRRILHDLITGQDLSFEDILQIAKAIKAGNY